MPSNNQRRARAQRSVSTAGTENHQGALGLISTGLETMVQSLLDKANEGDVQAARVLLSLQSEEFSRSRSGANDPLMIRIKEIREAGSKMEEELWSVLYRKVEVPVFKTP